MAAIAKAHYSISFRVFFVPEEASWTSVASEGTVLEDICLDFFFAIGRTSLLYLFSHVFVEVSLWLVSVFVIFRPKSVALLLGHNTECDDFRSAGPKY